MQNKKNQLIFDYLKTCPDPDESLNIYRQALTEQSNPKTRELSQDAKAHMPKAIQAVLDVEISALRDFINLNANPDLQNIFNTLQDFKYKNKHKNTFLIGCGASGRLALLLEQMLPEFNIQAVIAGGDIALVNSLPFFEDSKDKAITQLLHQGFQPGDSLIGLSASGTARFVLNALDYASQNNFNNTGSFLLITCNPQQDKTGRTHRSTPTLNINTEPPAISGSTRMHPTSLMMLTLLSLKYSNLESFQKDIFKLINMLENLPISELAPLTNLEADQTKNTDQKIIYNIQSFSQISSQIFLTVFTDLTERSPTFNLPPLLPNSDPEYLNSPCFPLFSQYQNSKQVWQALIPHRKIICLENKDFPETQINYLNSYNFSSYPFFNPALALTISDFSDHPSQPEIKFSYQNLSFSISTSNIPKIFIPLVLKIILNTHSSCVGAKQGKIIGNIMSHQTANNIKLIARAEICAQKYFKGERKGQIRAELIKLLPQLKSNQSLYELIIQALG